MGGYTAEPDVPSWRVAETALLFSSLVYQDLQDEENETWHASPEVHDPEHARLPNPFLFLGAVPPCAVTAAHLRTKRSPSEPAAPRCISQPWAIPSPRTSPQAAFSLLCGSWVESFGDLVCLSAMSCRGDEPTALRNTLWLPHGCTAVRLFQLRLSNYQGKHYFQTNFKQSRVWQTNKPLQY